MARKVGYKVNCVLVGGESTAENAKKLLPYGVDTVYAYEHPGFEGFRADCYADAVADCIAATKPSSVLIGATALGRSLAPRLSTRFHTGLTADCTALAHGAIDCCIANTPERAASVWAVRGGILEGMKADSVAQEECDVVVPRACIAEYVKADKRIALSHGIRVEPCGHCGDGNIHTEMLRGADMSDEEWKRATHASLTELYALFFWYGMRYAYKHKTYNYRSFSNSLYGRTRPLMSNLYEI